MTKIVLKFGSFAGLIMSALMAATIPFVDMLEHGGTAMLLGYTTMVLGFLMVFFGVRSYRDNVGGGNISFGKAFGMGLLIMLIGCSFYVVTWQIMYFNVFPDFLERYAAVTIENEKKAGASPEAIEKMTKEMADFSKQYKESLLFNAAITMMEPLPPGLLIALISAAALRRKPQAVPQPA